MVGLCISSGIWLMTDTLYKQTDFSAVPWVL